MCWKLTFKNILRQLLPVLYNLCAYLAILTDICWQQAACDAVVHFAYTGSDMSSKTATQDT